ITTILEAAAANGIKGIEICHEALLKHAIDHTEPRPASEEDISETAILDAARDIKKLSDSLDVTIIVLQPFASYEGLVDRTKHRRKVQKWSHWLDIAVILGCDIIQMPSNFNLEGTTGDMDTIVADMREVADLALAAQLPVRIAYEAVAWGTHFDLWEQSWDVVKAVDRSNFGLCLDTFHIVGRVWGDPTREDGRTPNADADIVASISRLVDGGLDVEKVFYLQLSDAERLAGPLIAGHPLHVPGQRDRCTWSRSARLFPCEEHRGGYLPVLEVTKAIVNGLGYRGWISMETFSRHLCEPDANIPGDYAKRARRS
ncbi:hypothetical protein LTR17_027908, partial [Elasticomyces elasticus]